MATKKIVPPHKKTVLYITPVGQQPIPSEVVECYCEETKGQNHISAKGKREQPTPVDKH